MSNKKTILVTGGAGFIGSNFIRYFANKYSNYYLVNLDILTYASDLQSLKEVEGKDNYIFVQGNICDKNLVKSLFKKYDVKGVINFAAESHVDNSITKPESFIETNINGTFNLIENARLAWMHKPHEYKIGYEDSRFHHISTDEVYGTLGNIGLFKETTPYAPNSPYSASKAASDFLVRSYFHTFGLNVSTSNCSNNYGPWQHDEKLIPTIIRNALKLQAIPIYGDGKNIRDWLYVLDHCKAIDIIFHKGRVGATYNIGGRNEKHNLEVVEKICEILEKIKPRHDSNKYADLINLVKDRPGHDRRYAIDATKLEKELNWKSDENFNTGIEKTVAWYINKYK